MTTPFYFIPIPLDFHKNGWTKDPCFAVYVLWAFSRCQATSKKVFHDHKEINLAPFEYISGRTVCKKETGLTDRQIRTQQERLEKSGYLKKATSKTTNKFTVYTWVTDAFTQIRDQQNDQEATSRRPAGDHNQEQQNLDLRSGTTPTPLKKKKGGGGFYDCLKEIGIPENRKVGLTEEYTEIRVEMAVKFVQHEDFVPTKGIMQALIWHCKQITPPQHAEKPKPEWERLAHKHNEIYAEHRPKAYEKNKELIKEQRMMIWQIDQFVPISLGNSIEVLKKDFIQAVKEYKIELKNWKNKQEKVLKMEKFA